MQDTQEMQVQSLGREDPLEEGTATHSSALARRIPGTAEPGGLPSTGLDMTENRQRQGRADRSSRRCSCSQGPGGPPSRQDGLAGRPLQSVAPPHQSLGWGGLCPGLPVFREEVKI